MNIAGQTGSFLANHCLRAMGVCVSNHPAKPNKSGTRRTMYRGPRLEPPGHWGPFQSPKHAAMLQRYSAWHLAPEQRGKRRLYVPLIPAIYPPCASFVHCSCYRTRRFPEPKEPLNSETSCTYIMYRPEGTALLAPTTFPGTALLGSLPR